MKIMKKEDMIEHKWMPLIKREVQIMRIITDSHPFILNLIAVIQTMVSIRPKLSHLFNKVNKRCKFTSFIPSTSTNL